MGYQIYREVKVWAPGSLTHREKLTALVLADDANDSTRLTFSSVVAPEILQFAMVKNDRDMRKVLAKLQDAKVIEQAVSGHNGRIAKFRFLHLDPAGCPGSPECACPTASLAVQKEPPTLPLELSSPAAAKGVGGSDTTAYANPSDEDMFQKEPPTEGVGGSNRHRRRSKTNRPTPSTSSTTSSSPSRKRAEPAPKATKHAVADELTERFWEIHGKGRTQSYLAIRGVVRTAISNGIARDDLARALHQVALEGRAISGGSLQVALRPSNRPNHQPYRTPDDPSIYDSEF